MKKGWIVCLCVLLGACTFKKQQIKGVVIDITMDTVTVGVDRDTLLFCIQDANRENAKGILINDTLEVTYLGNYKKGMSATRLVLHPQQKNIVGGDRDEHDHFFNTGKINNHPFCIKLFRTAINGDNPIVTMQIGTFTVIRKLQPMRSRNFHSFNYCKH